VRPFSYFGSASAFPKGRKAPATGGEGKTNTCTLIPFRQGEEGISFGPDGWRRGEGKRETVPRRARAREGGKRRILTHKRGVINLYILSKGTRKEGITCRTRGKNRDTLACPLALRENALFTGCFRKWKEEGKWQDRKTCFPIMGDPPFSTNKGGEERKGFPETVKGLRFTGCSYILLRERLQSAKVPPFIKKA